ncbi:MAG TPA: hypothetical protein VGB17_01050 [Pyrinomonadaceae bacterium]|jgi:hypothetical protein
MLSSSVMTLALSKSVMKHHAKRLREIQGGQGLRGCKSKLLTLAGPASYDVCGVNGLLTSPSAHSTKALRRALPSGSSSFGRR